MTTSNRRRFILSISLLLALYAAHADGAITYVVTNTVPRSHGGKKFAHSLDAVGAKHVMSAATPFIWQTFRQTNSPAGRKHVGRVSLFVDVMNGVAYTSGDEIHVSAGYISAYKGNVAREITGVIYHEMTHVWQWNGRGQTPGGLIEGVADFVRLKAGYEPSHWVAAGEGDRWDEGYVERGEQEKQR